MSHYDFATVQVYQTPEHLEITFPYNQEFISFLKGLKGRWNPERRCWTIKSELTNKTTNEIIFEIEDRLYSIAPKGWKKAVGDLKKLACLVNGYGILAGAGGVRLTLPSGHPGHYYLKDVQGTLQNRNTWSISADLMSHPEIKKIMSRIIKEDKNKFFEWMEVSEDRCVIGNVNIPPELEHVYNLEKGNLILATKSFMMHVDPGIGDAPLDEFCFELVSSKRIKEDKLKVRMNYPDVEKQYNFLRDQKYNNEKPKVLDVDIALDDWIQKRA
jgi:hypothetical protein